MFDLAVAQRQSTGPWLQGCGFDSRPSTQVFSMGMEWHNLRFLVVCSWAGMYLALLLHARRIGGTMRTVAKILTHLWVFTQWRWVFRLHRRVLYKIQWEPGEICSCGDPCCGTAKGEWR